MMSQCFKLSFLALIVATAGVCFAEEAPKVESDTIKGTTIKFDLVKLPAGKITIKDKEYEIKPVWFGKTEVTWDEYDVYWQRLDLTADEVKNGIDAENRPSKPY